MGALLLFRHSAKSSIAQKERLVTSPQLVTRPQLVVRLHAHEVGVVILILNSRVEQSVGLSAKDEAVGARYHADVIYLLL